MYKIFINDKPFVITASDTDDPRFASCKRVHAGNTKDIIDEVRLTEALQSKGVILICENADEAFRQFKSWFISIEAGGGIVFNAQQNILLIKRLGKWDLPKGKIDPGES